MLIFNFYEDALLCFILSGVYLVLRFNILENPNLIFINESVNSSMISKHVIYSRQNKSIDNYLSRMDDFNPIQKVCKVFVPPNR